jgi:hypothetical protein
MARSEWEETIQDLLSKRGWIFHHQRPAWTSKGYRSTISGEKGFPDFICFREEKSKTQEWDTIRQVVIEAKAGSDKPTTEQRMWLEFFREVGAEVYVWYPKDREYMEKVLM